MGLNRKGTSAQPRLGPSGVIKNAGLFSLRHARKQPSDHIGERKCLKKFIVHRGHKCSTARPLVCRWPARLSKLPS
jgi:hypothetical protein